MEHSDSDLLHNLIHERLRHVDSLVVNRKLDEAAKEISEIRKIDPKNAFALAMEERVFALLGKPAADSEATSSHAGTLPASPAPPDAHHPDTDRRDDSHTGSTPPQQNTKESHSVLVIDDDTLLLGALTDLLEENSYRVISYTRSEEAMDYLASNAPDIIICDVNLETSGYGGFSLYEKVRKLGHLRDVPFVFLSGLTDAAMVLAGKQLGADDYLTKPIEPEALLGVVKGKLRRYRQIRDGR